jgi:hypothetical protein
LKPTPASEKAVEAWVIDLFKKAGCHVWKTSQPRSSMITEGLPDLWVFCPRRSRAWWWEVKNERAMKKPNNGLSMAQLHFQHFCTVTGTRHYVGGLDEARQLLRELGITLEPVPLPLPAHLKQWQ